MTKLSQPGSRREDERLTYLHLGRRSALSLAVAVALGLPGAVLAQDAPAADAELEEIVVTGIRASITQAIEVKAESGSIVEAISAEDIGKLPDTSIAESISRLPGITSQRAEGRASAISLRGTDPGFTSALLNGREQVSTGDNRSVEFDQYPSELINQVVVYKTPDARLVGQGLAGTIDLRTVRPLDYGRQAVVVNLRGERNSHSDGDLGADYDDTGYRASLSYIDQFMDGKLGVAFGYARLNSPIATKGFGTYEPWKVMGDDGNPNTHPGFPPTALRTEGMKVRTDMGSTVRDGLMAAVQYEPNDFYSTTVDAYYSTMDQTDNARSIEFQTNSTGWPVPCCDGPFPNGTIFGFSNITLANNAVVAGNLNTILPLARNFLFKTEDEILAGGWLNEFQLNDEWKLLADVSYSKATREQDQFETNAQIKPLGATATRPNNVYDNGVFELSRLSFPTVSLGRNYADPNQVQVGPTIYGAGWTKAPEVEDELTSFRADAVRETAAVVVLEPVVRPELQRSHQGQDLARGAPEHAADGRWQGVLADRSRVFAAAGQPQLRERRQDARLPGGPGARQLLPADHLQHPDHAGVPVARGQVVGCRGESVDRLRARRSRPRPHGQRTPQGQRRPAGHQHRPEFRLLRGGQ